jgi:hypothetical protein
MLAAEHATVENFTPHALDNGTEAYQTQVETRPPGTQASRSSLMPSAEQVRSSVQTPRREVSRCATWALRAGRPRWQAPSSRTGRSAAGAYPQGCHSWPSPIDVPAPDVRQSDSRGRRACRRRTEVYYFVETLFSLHQKHILFKKTLEWTRSGRSGIISANPVIGVLK